MTTETSAAVDHVIGIEGQVTLRSRSGDVRVRGAGGETVRIRARDGRSLEGLAVEPLAGGLAVTGRGGAASMDLDVEVPAGATVSVETVSGDIGAAGLSGEQRYRTASGDLDLRGVHGEITVEAVSGDVDVIADGPASIRARTVSGDLAIRAGTIVVLRVGTTSGDLRIAGRFDGPGPFAIETVSGDAIVAAANDLRVEVQTITGRIRADVTARLEEAPGRRTLVTGEGGPTVSFRSTSGDLRVVPVAPLANGLAVSAPVSAPAVPAAAGHDDRPPHEDPFLDVLRALERGDLDIAEAGRRLTVLDDAPDDEEADLPTPAPTSMPDATEADHAR